MEEPRASGAFSCLKRAPGFWQPIPNNEGILIRDEAIESVEFVWSGPKDGRGSDARAADGDRNSSGEDPGT